MIVLVAAVNPEVRLPPAALPALLRATLHPALPAALRPTRPVVVVRAAAVIVIGTAPSTRCVTTAMMAGVGKIHKAALALTPVTTSQATVVWPASSDCQPSIKKTAFGRFFLFRVMRFQNTRETIPLHFSGNQLKQLINHRPHIPTRLVGFINHTLILGKYAKIVVVLNCHFHSAGIPFNNKITAR